MAVLGSDGVRKRSPTSAEPCSRPTAADRAQVGSLVEAVAAPVVAAGRAEVGVTEGVLDVLQGRAAVWADRIFTGASQAQVQRPCCGAPGSCGWPVGL